jgi:hypothetical protein
VDLEKFSDLSGILGFIGGFEKIRRFIRDLAEIQELICGLSKIR